MILITLLLAACAAPSSSRSTSTPPAATHTQSPLPSLTDSPLIPVSVSSTLTPSPFPIVTERSPYSLLTEQIYSPYEQLTALAWTPDGAYLGAGAGNNVHVYTFRHPERLAEQDSEGSPGNEEMFRSAQHDESGEPVLTELSILPIGAWTSQLLFDSFPMAGETSLRLALSARDGTVQFWDAASATKLASWAAHRISAYSISLNPNGIMLASSGNDAMVRLWDLTAYRNTGVAAIPEIAEMIGGAFAVPAVRFSPSGDLIASVDTQAIRLRQPSTQRLVTTLRPEASIFTIEFSPDGRWLADAEVNNTVRLWNVETGEQRAVFAGPLPLPGRTAPFIWDIAFSPDGSLIAAGGSDGMLRLWSVETGEVIAEWQAHSKAITCLRFRPDGLVLASGGVDAALRLWSIILD